MECIANYSKTPDCAATSHAWMMCVSHMNCMDLMLEAYWNNPGPCLDQGNEWAACVNPGVAVDVESR